MDIHDSEYQLNRGDVEDWIDIELGKPIDKLCSTLIPKLGTEEFFALI